MPPRDEVAARILEWVKGAVLIFGLVYFGGLLILCFGVALTMPIWIWWVA